MKLYLIDGTYELFRAYYAMPSLRASDGREVGAVRGLIQTLLLLLRQPEVTHVACAFDHTIESFRNSLFSGYKDGSNLPLELWSQFEMAEQAASALGIIVWPMVEFEADDAIATAALRWVAEPTLEQIVVCSPDKDLSQIVQADRIVCLDRRRERVLNEAGVILKFGVRPVSIPDYLALVGDTADGIPGIKRWGAKSTATLLQRYGHIENIPQNSEDWVVQVRGATAMAGALLEQKEDALLYKKLATLRTDVPLAEDLPQLKWRGVVKERFVPLCQNLSFDRLMDAPHRWAEA